MAIVFERHLQEMYQKGPEYLGNVLERTGLLSLGDVSRMST